MQRSDFGKWREEQRELRRRSDAFAFRSRCGLGSQKLKMRFETFKSCRTNELALRKAQALAEKMMKGEDTRGLVLYGATGRGKTHLACAIVNAVIDSGAFALFLPSVEIPKDDQDAVLELTDRDMVPLLVLDDLGAEKPTDRLLECLHIIVDGRLSAEAPLVVTTNLDENGLRTELGDYCGPRMVGRLREMCEWVPVGGEDRRKEL